MNGEIYNSLRRNLQDAEYSEGYAEEFLNAYIATQIKVIREQREMTQAELGKLIGTTQAGVSRYENVNYPSWSIQSLKKVARALRVRLKVSFETFGSLPDEVIRFRRESLERVDREHDPSLGETASIPDYDPFVVAMKDRPVVNIEEWKQLSGVSLNDRRVAGDKPNESVDNTPGPCSSDDRSGRHEYRGQNSPSGLSAALG